MKGDKLIGEEQGILEKQEQLNEQELIILERQLDTYTLWIKCCSLISLISFSFFLILLTIKLNSQSSLNWLYVFIPILITVISSSIFLNCYLIITSLIEKFDNGSTSKGTLISFFCLNTAYLILMIYFILLSLKMDNNYEIHYSYAFSPIYISLFLHIIYTTIYLFKGECCKSIFSGLTLVSVLSAFLFLGLMLDKFISISYLVIGCLFITAYHIYAVEKIYITFIEIEPKENTVV